MRVFDYKCLECGAVKEKFVRGDETVRCECGAEMKRQVSAPAMVKGNFADGTGFKERK